MITVHVGCFTRYKLSNGVSKGPSSSSEEIRVSGHSLIRAEIALENSSLRKSRYGLGRHLFGHLARRGRAVDQVQKLLTDAGPRRPEVYRCETDSVALHTNRLVVVYTNRGMEQKALGTVGEWVMPPNLGLQVSVNLV